MTEAELRTLLTFLVAGFCLGTLAAWGDLLRAWIADERG